MDRYPNTERLIFIAGGIGITPILSMLNTMVDRGDKRPVKLFYNNRDWDSLTFREEIEALKKKVDLEIIYTLEVPPEEWKGEVGYMTREILRKYLPGEWIQSGSHIFMCGPQIMMDIVEKQCLQEGFQHEQIHFERFDFV
jgi:ferredoxin-NADP reductase